nr:centrosomal protein of 192 kDa [Hymenolepis microstoma]
MEGCDSRVLGRISGAFESPLSNTFMDSLQPIAQSSAIRSSTGCDNATYTINKNSENQSGSLNLLNLNNLSSKLLSFSLLNEKNSTPTKKNTTIIEEEEPGCEEEVEEHQANIALNDDELRNLENAFSELSTCPRDTGAIATSVQGTDGITTDLQTADTDVDGLPSFSIDDGDNVIESLVGCQVQDQNENQSNGNDLDWLLARTEKEKECLSTIYEWQSRESFTNASDNRSASKFFDSCDGEEQRAIPVTMFSPLSSPVKRNGVSGVNLDGPDFPRENLLDIFENGIHHKSTTSPQVIPRSTKQQYVPIGLDTNLTSTTPTTVFRAQPTTTVTYTMADASGTKAVATSSVIPPVTTTGNLDATSFTLGNISKFDANSFTLSNLSKSGNQNSGVSSNKTNGEMNNKKHPLMATTRCLLWRSATYEHESKQHFVLRQDSDRVMRLKLEIIDGIESFFSTTAYNRRAEEKLGLVTLQENTDDKENDTSAILMSGAPVNGSSGPRTSGVLQSSNVLNSFPSITNNTTNNNNLESTDLLDHRGQQIARRWRIIDLPPRLACTITVVYKPRPPLSWHTGILAFSELPGVGVHPSGTDVRPRCYVQRLIGYVGGSNILCGICRAVDEKTYWTSAFSTPQDAQDESFSFKSQSPTYYACVSLRNTGLRSAWIYAVAIRPNEDPNISQTPLSGVSIRPSRFVLQPNESQNVTIGICDESREIQVFFYTGDEVLRYLYKSRLVTEGRPSPSLPSTIPKPHRRLRSAYVLCPFEGETQEMLTEIPSNFQRDLYDWHEALVDEQRSCPPISLTIYPLLNDNAPPSSFEASSSLIVGSNLEGDVENVRMEELARLEHQSTKVAFDGHHSSSALLTGGDHSAAKEMVQLSSGSTAVGQQQQSVSIVYDDLQLYKESTVSSMKHQSEETASHPPPLISIRPESQLIFAPWNYKKPTTGILELKLSLPEVVATTTNNTSTNTTGSTATTSSTTRRQRSKTWRLYWSARPVVQTHPSVFSVILPAIPLTVQAEQTHYFAFRFEPPHNTPPGSRFEERWELKFQFSDDITASLLSNSMSADKPTQSVEVLFVATTATDAAVASSLSRKVIAPKLPIKIKKIPLLFQGESQELQCEIVNISKERVIITLGLFSSPLFELVKPNAHKFYIDPQYSVRLRIRCRMENAPRGSNEKEISATLALTCALESDRSNKQEISIPMKAIL